VDGHFSHFYPQIVESTTENGVEVELWIIVDTKKLTTILFVDPQILGVFDYISFPTKYSSIILLIYVFCNRL